MYNLTQPQNTLLTLFITEKFPKEGGTVASLVTMDMTIKSTVCRYAC